MVNYSIIEMKYSEACLEILKLFPMNNFWAFLKVVYFDTIIPFLI